MTTITSTAPTTITANIWPNIIDGREVGGGGEEALRDSPAHDIRVASYHSAGEADVDAAVKAAHRAFSAGDWPQVSGGERAALLRRVAGRIEAERDALALIETLESGKPISQARDEVSSAAGIWYYAASLAQHAYGDAHNDLGPNYLAVTVKEPIGVVGVITPWNFPLLIVSQKLHSRWQSAAQPWSSPVISHRAPPPAWSRCCTTKARPTASSILFTAVATSAGGCRVIQAPT